MKMKMSWKIGAIIGLVAMVSMAAIGVSYASTGNPNPAGKSLTTFSWVKSNDPLGPPVSSDPKAVGTWNLVAGNWVWSGFRSSSDVASTQASIWPDNFSISIAINNAYPGYYSSTLFGVSNQWPTPGIVQSVNVQYSPQLTVSIGLLKVNDIINSGQEDVGFLSIGTTDSNLPQGKPFNVIASIITTQFTAKGVLNVTTPALSNGTVGWEYTQELGAAMGNYPYTWSLVSGSLPPGFSLNSSGILNGIPAAKGTYNFTVKVMDTTNDSATKALSLTIN
jgi:Putative Ig domain